MSAVAPAPCIGTAWAPRTSRDAFPVTASAFAIAWLGASRKTSTRRSERTIWSSRWKRPRCLLCPAIASVSADRIDAPESSRAVISGWLLDCRRTDSLGSLVRGSGGPTRPVCGRWLGLRGSRQGHILRGSSARQSEYLTVRKPRPRRRVVSHERGGVCEACSVWRWWSCFWRLAGK